MKQLLVLGLVVAVITLGGTAIASADGWGQVTRVESIPGTSANFNYSGLDGCPYESPDGLSFYMATDRPGGFGGIDIWRATRGSLDEPWGAPENLGAPVNSSANDFCPTPVEDGRLFFVSTRAGGCGGPDIYVASPTAAGGWAEPQNIGCKANSPGEEFSPSLVVIGPNDAVLFFSSNRPGGFSADAAGAAPDHDIYYSRVLPGGTFDGAILVNNVNSAAGDFRPNVRLDGLEIVFDSSRPGGLGMTDIWVASRPSTHSPWSGAVHLPAPINSDTGESRPSLSRTGDRLYFGSARPGGDGGSDVYVAVRDGTGVQGSSASTAGSVTPPNTGDAGLRSAAEATPALAIAMFAVLVSLAGRIGRSTSA
jgi:hypothetical protein